MIITCPCCGGRFSIEAALVDEAARQSVAAALKLPAPLGDLILRYLGLFRPEQRALSWERVPKLLAELKTPIQAAMLRRDGRDWAAPQELWKAALEQVLAARDAGKLTLPLKGHGYLFQIVAGMASKAMGQAERAAEEQKSYRYGRDSQPEPTPAAKMAQTVEGVARGRAALKERLKGGE